MNFYLNVPQFVSSENVFEYVNTIHYVRKSTNLTLFLKNLVVSGSSLHEVETCYGCDFD